MMRTYKNFRPSDDLYWLLNLACLKHTGMMLPDAYADNTNWTKDDKGKSKLILNPRLLQPSYFNDISLQIKRSMVVGDLKILFRGRDNFEDAYDERSAKQIMLSKFSRTGNLTDLVEVPHTDIQVPVGYRTNIMGQGSRAINFLSKYRFGYDDISKYALKLLMNTDLTKEQVLGVVETFKTFKQSTPMGSAPKWKTHTSILGDGYEHTSITKMIWNSPNQPMKYFARNIYPNKHTRYTRGWQTFKDEGLGLRPEFFFKRRDSPKVKKNASSEEVCEWFFHQFYLIVWNNRDCPYQYRWNSRESPLYEDLDRATRLCIASGWDKVKSKSKIDIEDEFRIFAMPEYKIKPRTYESIVNSIAW